MIKLTIEINEETYSIETNDVNKIKLFIDHCLETEEKIKKAIDELKHW